MGKILVWVLFPLWVDYGSKVWRIVFDIQQCVLKIRTISCVIIYVYQS